MNANHARPMLAFCVLALLAAVFTTLGLQQDGTRLPTAGSAPRSANPTAGSVVQPTAGPGQDELIPAHPALPGLDLWTSLTAAQDAVPTGPVAAVATTGPAPGSPATAVPVAAATVARKPSSAAPAPAPKPRRRHVASTATATTTTTGTATTTTGHGRGKGHGKGHGKGPGSIQSTVVVSAPKNPGKGHQH